MSIAVSRIAENLATVRQRMADAANRSGRTAEAVRLIAVTKYGGSDLSRAVLEAGCADLGENRPQMLWEKADQLHDLPIRWHLVGSLQRNKARRTLPLLARIHSADSLRLLQTLDRLARETHCSPPVLLEVNVSGDVTKQGFSPEEMPALGEQLQQFSSLAIDGLMCIATNQGPQYARSDFQRLRELRDHLQAIYPPEVNLSELSMGMSGDYEVAIEEGSTMVRIGSALYDGVQGV